MLEAALEALIVMMDPLRLLILAAGVCIGLAIGVIPGLGGIVGLALLIPFTYGMDQFAAFAFLLGMAAVTATSDTIPAVLFGVPGTVGSAATVLDGHPLAKQGQAGRAFGAAYAASLFGGVFGALVLALSIPILRPVMLYIGSPELLALTVFGLSMVAVLSGRAPFKGVAVAAIGLMIAMIGAGPQTGTLRWTFGSFYLWDGLPLVPVTLGLFAIPELASLAVRRTNIAGDANGGRIVGQWTGIREVFRHKFLVLRCSGLGALLGAVPGIGSSVIDWVAYGHAARSEKNTETFGSGDIRGVIASESSNNAKEGGALVPTIAFGVPGSASMALLLAAFLMHGLIPGPEMLTRNLNVTYAIIWTLAFANILGAGICLASSGILAKISLVRFGVLLPIVLAVTYVGAFQGSSSWGDLFSLILFGAIGWIMKLKGWPRPPLILGFVLGDIFERYLFISVERYGVDWLLRPGVVVILLMAAWGMYQPIRAALKRPATTSATDTPPQRQLALDAETAFTAAIIVLVAYALYRSIGWPVDAALVPQTAGIVALVALLVVFARQIYRYPAPTTITSSMPTSYARYTDFADIVDREVTIRSFRFFAALVLYLAGAGLMGFLIATPIFVAAYMMVEGRERATLAMITAAGVTLFCWIVFDRMLALAWPLSYLGDWLPALRSLTGVV